MKRTLRTAFVVTVSTIANTACQEAPPRQELHWNPPPRERSSQDAGPAAPSAEPLAGHPSTEPFHTINPPGVVPFHPDAPDGGK
jgi:hypothetical protein